ncbi:MAG TPA: pantoate--beta-alanine ligase [Nitrospira sp.]|nr:pantoate--beta-alanine ligase [Nitrospira sp.]
MATVEYLAVCHPATLEPLRVIERHAVLLGVIRVGAVRLLDNLLVTYRHKS